MTDTALYQSSYARPSQMRHSFFSGRVWTFESKRRCSQFLSMDAQMLKENGSVGFISFHASTKRT